MRRRRVGDEGAEVLTRVDSSLLALDVGQLHPPVVENLASELPFLGRDQHRTLRLGHQTAYLLERTVRGVPLEPVVAVGSDPLATNLIKRALEQAHQCVSMKSPRVDQVL